MVRIESVVRADTLFVMVPEKNPKISFQKKSKILVQRSNPLEIILNFSKQIRDPNW